ncbi:sensor histidine kinase [Methylobrevis albus]|uniref:histidine kinase n=1 Tax=Methylobrevis albus TaxID=2793297 RepID=A0A931N0Q5_9HYPH|nr:ATP-binding protein [Methylobrevis albus]MBH0239469.1 sensor histidine kinase [Methylobrevis albus]
MVPSSRLRRPSPRALLLTAAGALVVAAAAYAAFEVTLAGDIDAARERAELRLGSFESTLEMIVERYRFLPTVVAQAREVRAVLRAPDDPLAVAAANAHLSRLEDSAAADELFVMNPEGRILAAGNWWSLETLVGADRSQRPYFAGAIARGSARMYAVGLTTNLPGYFLAQRVDDGDTMLGVAVAKVSLGELEAIWWRSGEEIAVVDEAGTVLLSTRPDWRFRQLADGEDAVLARRDRWRGAERVTFAGGDPEGAAILDAIRLPSHDWRLLYFTPFTEVTGRALTMAVLAALLAGGLLLAGLAGWQRRRANLAVARAAKVLERRVAERTTELRAVNARLEAEVAERRRAEVGLVQAAKLASLGQTMAGIAHEISQPIAALRTSAASLKIVAARDAARPGGGGPEGAERIARTIASMAGMIDRLAALTDHLRSFARKDTAGVAPVDPLAAVDAALGLLAHRLEADGVTVERHGPRHGLVVAANPIRLEQVFVNLLANALDAMEASAVRRLTIAVEAGADAVDIAVSDTGAGMPAEVIAQLFDPFFTTKEAGRGLGLGLSISAGIVAEIGGRIAVASVPGTGTTFTVHLPRAAAG